MNADFLESCTPGYYNNEGSRSARTGRAARSSGAAQNGPYGGGAIAFVKLLEDWRAEGSLAGMELRWSAPAHDAARWSPIALADARTDTVKPKNGPKSPPAAMLVM